MYICAQIVKKSLLKYFKKIFLKLKYIKQIFENKKSLNLFNKDQSIFIYFYYKQIYKFSFRNIKKFRCILELKGKLIKIE